MASRCGGGTPDVQARSKEGFCGHRLWEPGMGGLWSPRECGSGRAQTQARRLHLQGDMHWTCSPLLHRIESHSLQVSFPSPRVPQRSAGTVSPRPPPPHSSQRPVLPQAHGCRLGAELLFLAVT